MKKALILLAALALMAGSAFAQNKSGARYAPGREKLAEETFKQLVAISSGYDQLNLATDLAASQKAIEEYPELRAAMLENYIFAYCHVDDSLKTAENLLVNKLDGMSFYTARSNEKWNELGEVYTAKRREIRREYAEE
ncbi:MAG: hypothetical protein J6S99_05830 [Bacteroidales bacterium]|nr:hypothetical protein [Bacteroidales bacterium]